MSKRRHDFGGLEWLQQEVDEASERIGEAIREAARRAQGMTTLTELHRDISRHLDEIRRLLPPGMRLTLIARDPCVEKGDVMVSDDMHQLGMLLRTVARFHTEGRPAGDSVIHPGPAGTAAPAGGNSKVDESRRGR